MNNSDSSDTPEPIPSSNDHKAAPTNGYASIMGATRANAPKRDRAGILRIARLILGIVAVGLAFFAEKIAEDNRTQGAAAPDAGSWWLFGLAAVLFAVAMWPVPRLLATEPNLFFKTLRALRRRWLFVGLLGAAIVCCLGAVPLFMSLNSNVNILGDWLVNTGSWLLWILALLLFAAAWVVWERNTPPGPANPAANPPGDRLPIRIEWLVMAGLFVLALILRVPNLDNTPPGIWFDEAQNGIVGEQLLKPEAVHVPFLGDLTQMGALYFYFQGLLIKLLGNTVWALRLPAALSGSLIVPMLYLLASRLYGWRVGMAAAGLLAFSAWNITFSRFGMASLATVALDVAVYLCIMQALRTGRLGYFAGAGVLLGLALHGYYPSRLVPLVLVAVLLHRLITERARLIRAVRTGAIVFAVGALIAFMPVGTFAAQHWDVYNSRISTVSIFSQEGSGGNPNALSESINKHMLMFNYHGDGNGRHNLPEQPMLDWLTAALFFLGLGSCVARGWRWQYFFPVVWFVAALSGGVLSLLFEAPQAHRTLENSVVTALLAGIALGQLWELVSRAIAPQAARLFEAARATQARTKAPREERTRRARRAPKTPIPTLAGFRTTLPMRNASAARPATTLPVRVHPAVTPLAEAVPTMAVTATAVADPLLAEKGIVEAPSLDRMTSNGAVVVQEPVEKVKIGRRLAVAMAASALGIIAVVGWVGSITVNRYFNVQMKDHGVWSSMYAAETQAARVLAQYNSIKDVYITPIFIGLPPSRYLAPDIMPREWLGMQIMPLSDTGGNDVVIAADPPSVADLAAIARLYPHATFEPLYTPDDHNSPLMWTIYIPASDITGLGGVHAQFFAAGGTTPPTEAKPSSDTTLQGMSVDWSKQSKPGTVRLSATLKVNDFGNYIFSLKNAEPGAQPSGLLVDGFLVKGGEAMQLGSGLHSIVATDTVQSLSGVTSVSWTTGEQNVEADIPTANLFDPRKVEPHGLTGVFRQGDSFDTPIQNGRVDPVISAYFHHTPLNRPYTGEWTGRIYIPEDGLYTFTTEQLSKSRLYLDGNLIIENLSENNAMDSQQQLNYGWHEIKMQYEDLSGFSHVYLYWTPPGGTRSIIPSAFLWPHLGSYPSNLDSGQFPTLAQANGMAIPADRIVGPGAKAAAGKPNAVEPQPTTTGNRAVPEPPAQGVGVQATQTAVQNNQGVQSNPTPQNAPNEIPAEQMKALVALGGGAAGPARPQAVAADAQGNIYIYSDKDSKIYKYDSGGKLLTSWDVVDAQKKPLQEGSSILVKGDRVMLLDASTSGLLLYDLDGKPQGTQQLCQCYYPRAMTLAQDGNYWVADTGGTRIIKVSPDGKILKSIEGKGAEQGKFQDPAGVAESNTGTLYVSDNGNSRIQTFGSDDLKPRAQWQVPPSVARDGTRLATDSAGNVLVTEPAGQSVAMYDPTGKPLHRWTYTSNGKTLSPAGIAPLGNDRFIVLFPAADTDVVFSTTGK